MTCHNRSNSGGKQKNSLYVSSSMLQKKSLLIWSQIYCILYGCRYSSISSIIERVLQHWTHWHTKAMLRRGFGRPVHPSLFHTGTGWKKLTWPEHNMHKHMRAQSLASTKVCYSPILVLSKIHLFTLHRKKTNPLHFRPHAVWKRTYPACIMPIHKLNLTSIRRVRV